MATIVELRVKPDFTKYYKNKFPLISKEAIINPGALSEEGTIVHSCKGLLWQAK